MSLCLCNEKTLSNRERCKEKIKFYALGASFLDLRDKKRLSGEKGLRQFFPHPAGHGCIVVEEINQIVRNPLRFETQQAEQDSAYAASHRDEEQLQRSEAIFRVHPADAFAVLQKLVEGHFIGITKTVLDNSFL